MFMSEEKREVRKANLVEALITFLGLTVVMAVSIIVFHVDPHVKTGVFAGLLSSK